VVGRTAEQRTITESLAHGTSVLLIGPAGIGKTTVADASIAATGHGARRGGAVHFLEAHPFLCLAHATGRKPALGDPATVAKEVMGAVGSDVLFLDDLQWADPDTIAVLPALAAYGNLIVAVRPGEGAADDVIASLLGSVTPVALEPLPLDDATDLLRMWRPHATDSEALELTIATDRNPLLLKLAAQTHAAAGSASISALIASCSPGAQLALARLAVGDTSADAATAGMEELERRWLVRIDDAGQVHLAGDLLGERALSMLDAPVRRSLHIERARAASEPGEAAVHWRAAGDHAAALAAANEAAATATTPAARAQHWTLAAEVAPSERIWEFTRRACDEWLRLGHLARIEALIEAAEAVEPCPVDAYDWDLMRAQLLIDRRDAPAALAVIAEAFERFPDVPDDYRCWLIGLRAASRGFLLDIDGAISDAQEAITLGRSIGISTAPAELILGSIHLFMGEPSWESTLSAVFAEATQADPPVALEAGAMLATGQFSSFASARAEDTCARLIELADAQSNLTWDRRARAIGAFHRSFRDLGSPATQRTLRELADDPATFNSRSSVLAALAIAEADHGDIRSAEARLRSGAPVGKGTEAATDPMLDWAAAEVAWVAGDPAACRDAAARSLAAGSPVDQGQPDAAILLRWSTYELGGDLTAIAGPLPIFASQGGFAHEAVALDHLAAGRAPEAAQAFLLAAEVHDQHLRRSALRCRWAAGAASTRAGEPAEAERLLLQVRATCIDLGFVPLQARIDRTLRELGALGTRVPALPSLAITRRQREILALVGQGLGTQQIAARLHISGPTVESHIRSAMQRLGAPSRMAAALQVEDDGA
jgi:DNA-binding NarL/FixJ family response regulator